jgi:hypothetical protein
MKQFAWALLAASAAYCQTPPIDDIMARVAANQEKSVEARKQFVYRQEELIRMLGSHGKVDCEQRREYTVTPSATGIERQLVANPENNGEPEHCSMHVAISNGEGLSVGSSTTETDSLSASLGKTRDGVPSGLFPLTADAQRLYQYKLEGKEKYEGRLVYRVSFRPNHRKNDDGIPGFGKGKALVDAQEFQPVKVVTDLTFGIPLSVQILLGTNVHGIGFTVTYQRLADGVWFPADFGGEFSVRALFFFKQLVSLNTKNSGFKRTDVNSLVTYEGK